MWTRHHAVPCYSRDYRSPTWSSSQGRRLSIATMIFSWTKSACHMARYAEKPLFISMSNGVMIWPRMYEGTSAGTEGSESRGTNFAERASVIGGMQRPNVAFPLLWRAVRPAECDAPCPPEACRTCTPFVLPSHDIKAELLCENFRWIDVPCAQEDALVFNCGDYLSLLSNGRLK